MPVDTTVRNGRIVTPGGVIDGTIAIDGEIIVGIGRDDALPEGRRTIDAQGRYVIPGVIDAHVHLGAGGIDWPSTATDFRSESGAAAYGGVTTALVFLFSLDSYLPVFDELVGFGEGNSLIDFAYHAGINSSDQIAEIPALIDRGVTSFKHFFTAYRGEGGGVIEAMDPGLLYQSFQMIGSVGAGALAQVHAEDMDLIRLHEAQLRASGVDTLDAWSDSRPPICEAIAIDQIASIAKDTGARPYIVHLSSAAGVEAVERAQRSGVPMIAETCPQYLTLDQTMESEIGCWGKVNPPIRMPADQERLWQALGDGSVTTLGTDHVPVNHVAKERGGGQYHNIWNSSPGIPNGMEHLLPVVWTSGVTTGRLSVEAFVRVSSQNTAQAFGLYPKKGALLPGSDADLVIVETSIATEIDSEFFHGIARDWSPYRGFPIRAVANTTMVRGHIVMSDREIVDPAPRGRFLARACQS